MIVAIVEDEPLLAGRLERFTRAILRNKLTKIVVKTSLPEAMEYLFERPVDLLLLDLNLHGRDGFELLKQAVSGAFQTIIVSAYSDRAVEAFEYGVLDFIGKPFTLERLHKAFSRLQAVEAKNSCLTKYLAVRKAGKLHLLDIAAIRYVRGAGIYSELIMKNGAAELHDKSLARLNAVLPARFVRIHKSYIVDIRDVKNLSSLGGSQYALELSSGETLPVSRKKYKDIKKLLVL